MKYKKLSTSLTYILSFVPKEISRFPLSHPLSNFLFYYNNFLLCFNVNAVPLPKDIIFN